jgi:hypothetical protein
MRLINMVTIKVRAVVALVGLTSVYNGILAAGANVQGTVLILARDAYSASTASSGLESYGIPYQTLLVPQTGATLPALNSSGTEGNFGGIIVMSALSYNYGSDYRSALTDAQWNDLYRYQDNFGVRMVRLDEFPGAGFGTRLARENSGCCATGVEQLVSFTDLSGFPTANLKADAGVSTKGLWHYPAVVVDTATTKQIAKFGPSGDFTEDTTAAIINTFAGRQQMVFFISWATDWSLTSNFLQHAYIHWMTRGLFLGKRKVHLNPQVDDMQLSTELYRPAGSEFKVRTADLDAHIPWQSGINGRLPEGSDFRLEIGHNGNGDIIAAVENTLGESICRPSEAVDYPYPPDTPLEFVKPPGTGTDIWPPQYQEYEWSAECAALDEFATWFLNVNNLNQFAHVSHTFTHQELNNATYNDAARDIRFNQAWLKQMGIDQATRFSPSGLIPPAITGLHNADAIKAWMDNGVRYVVGDNTRPVLRNPNSQYWPLVTTVEANGYAGLYIIPRYATTIYYNCDKPACTLQEWIDTSGGSGDFSNLLDDARSTNTRHLLGLQSDAYMFHQANMRQTDMETITVGNQSGKMSLVMIWVETVLQELTRLTGWPITSLKHDDVAQYFIDRMTLDACKPALSYSHSENGQTIVSVTVTTSGNSCAVPVPVTIPGGSTTASGGSQRVDQVGSEPPIVWVSMQGSPVTLTLNAPISV